MMRSRVRNAETMPVWVNSREFPGREHRVRVNMRASIQVTAERSVVVQIVNLSRGGFGLVSEEPLQAGQLVELSSLKDASSAEIRWVHGLGAGGLFTDRPRITE